MAGKFLGIFPFRGNELSCQKIRQMSSDYVEDALGSKMLWKFNYHTERCSGCSAFVSSLRATIRALNSLPGEKASEELRRRLRDLYSGGSEGGETPT
jgi:hypothetical protein